MDKRDEGAIIKPKPTTTATTIDKFQQLPENLQQEVADFIDFLVMKHQVVEGTIAV